MRHESQQQRRLCERFEEVPDAGVKYDQPPGRRIEAFVRDLNAHAAVQHLTGSLRRQELHLCEGVEKGLGGDAHNDKAQGE